MRTDCKKFALQCLLCARNKPSRHRPYSLLQPLPVPGRPWHSISMDFVEHLPTSNGLSWWLLTVWPSNVCSLQLRTLVLPRTLQIHSFPMCSQSIASLSICPPTADRNSPLGSLLRIRLHFTSCHHPSANGQVGRVNTTLEQSLRFYCNYEQGNWSTSLPTSRVRPPMTQWAYSLSSRLAPMIHWPCR